MSETVSTHDPQAWGQLIQHATRLGDLADHGFLARDSPSAQAYAGAVAYSRYHGEALLGVFDRHLSRHLDPAEGSYLFDLGCGAGSAMAALACHSQSRAPTGLRYVGVDHHPRMTHLARSYADFLGASKHALIRPSLGDVPHPTHGRETTIVVGNHVWNQPTVSRKQVYEWGRQLRQWMESCLCTYIVAVEPTGYHGGWGVLDEFIRSVEQYTEVSCMWDESLTLLPQFGRPTHPMSWEPHRRGDRTVGYRIYQCMASW